MALVNRRLPSPSGSLRPWACRVGPPTPALLNGRFTGQQKQAQTSSSPPPAPAMCS